MPGDPDIEIAIWRFLLEEKDGVSLTTAQAQALFKNLVIYLDTGDDNWSPEDTVVKTMASADISLTSGMLEFVFTDGDANLQVTQAQGSRTYFLVFEMKSDAAKSGNVKSFRVSFDPDTDAVTENSPADIEISGVETGGTNTGDITVIPEFESILLPIVAPLALLFYFRRKRARGE